MVPATGQIITIFRSRLRNDNLTAYSEHAAYISERARSMPGYVEHKAFTADDGERVTVVTFADAESHRAWRDDPEHRSAQNLGVTDYYDEYSIQVGPVEYASRFDRRLSGERDRHQVR